MMGKGEGEEVGDFRDEKYDMIIKIIHFSVTTHSWYL